MNCIIRLKNETYEKIENPEKLYLTSALISLEIPINAPEKPSLLASHNYICAQIGKSQFYIPLADPANSVPPNNQ